MPRSPKVRYTTAGVSTLVAANERHASDPSYRYMIPQLSFYPGRKNKYFLSNCTAFAFALKIRAEYVPLFLANVLETYTNCSLRTFAKGLTSKTGKPAMPLYWVKVGGKSPEKRLEQAVRLLLRVVLLCGECHVPEMVFCLSEETVQRMLIPGFGGLSLDRITPGSAGALAPKRDTGPPYVVPARCLACGHNALLKSGEGSLRGLGVEECLAFIKKHPPDYESLGIF